RDDERAQLALADVMIRADQFDAAEQALQATIQRIPLSGRAHYLLARLYQRENRGDDAVREFQRATAFHPLLGANGIYQALGAVALGPAHRQARYALGTALVRLGQIDDGQRELAEFERLQREDATARERELELGGLRREATVSSSAGDHQKAVALLRRALEIAP